MPRSLASSVVHAAVLAVATLSAAPAVAQGTSGDKAAANALFDEGKRLLAAGDVAQACARFEASLKVLDQLGTRLNLADCYEKAGRTASAWAEFREAASLADKRGDKRAKFSRDRADALRPKLVKLSINVPPANRLPGLEVRRNGAAVPAELFDTPVPIDPGKYAIEAAAGGFQPWSTTVDASAPGAELKVEVPKLDPVAKPPVVAKAPVAKVPAPAGPSGSAPGPRPAKPVEPPATKLTADAGPMDSAARDRRHLISYAVGGAGIVGLGIGTVLGFRAKSKWDDAGKHCAGEVCDAMGVAINRDARSLGTTGTIIGGIGLAAVAAAVVIYVTAPPAQAIAEHASLQLLPHAGGVMTWTGQF